jgi:iduronate 2-sulfatase
VLYFIVDDLRTQLGTYGHNTTFTPNLDKLAARGMQFNNAYCQQGVCSPSRNSFMSGRYPDSIKTWTFTTNFRQVPGGEDWVAFPEHFKLHGYTTLGGGKTYHPGRPPKWDEPKSWSQDQPYFPFNEPGCPASNTNPGGGYTHAFCPLDGPLSQFFDHNLANWTIQSIHYATKEVTPPKPWAIFAGFRRPHLPWQMPLSFWDLYADVDVLPPLHPQVPTEMPDISFTCGDECGATMWNDTTLSGCMALAWCLQQ